MSNPLTRAPVTALVGLFVCISASVFAAEDTSVDLLAGQWTLSINTPRGEQNPVLDITRNGEGYSGVYNSRRGPVEVPDIQLNGQQFAFPLVISIPIGTIEVTYTGTVTGDKMQGVAKNPRGEVPFSGRRR